MDNILIFFENQFYLFRNNLLNTRLDHYTLYVLIFAVSLLALFSLCLILKKEKLILPALLLSLLLTPGFYYLRELSPWSKHLKTAPSSANPGAQLIPKLGEAQVIDGQVIVNPQQGETPTPP